MARSWSSKDKSDLVEAWDAASPAQKRELAASASLTYPSLANYVGQWRRSTFPCLRRGCGNTTSLKQPYCSVRCRGLDRHSPDVVTHPLSRFLLGQLVERDMTRSELAGVLGVSPQTVTGWLKGRSLPGSSAYEGILRQFPDAPQHEPRDSTDRRRQQAIELSKEYSGLMHTPEAIRRRAATQRGRPRLPSGTRGQALAHRIANGEHDQEGALRASQRPDVRARAALTMRLNRHSDPDMATINRWAEEVASAPSIRLNREQVLAGWRPELAKRGIRLGGRPRKTTRLLLVEDARGRGRSWRQVARLVIEAEGLDRDPSDGEWVRTWYQRQPNRKGPR